MSSGYTFAISVISRMEHIPGLEELGFDFRKAGKKMTEVPIRAAGF